MGHLLAAIVSTSGSIMFIMLQGCEDVSGQAGELYYVFKVIGIAPCV